MAASRRVILRAGSGSRALPGDRPGRSAANVTSRSGVFAIARRQDVTARLYRSVGASFDPVRNLVFDVVIVASVASPGVVPAKAGTHNHRRLLYSDLWHRHSTERPQRMGSCFRRDDAQDIATFTEDSASSALKQR